jgi:hypothetical protein
VTPARFFVIGANLAARGDVLDNRRVVEVHPTPEGPMGLHGESLQTAVIALGVVFAVGIAVIVVVLLSRRKKAN